MFPNKIDHGEELVISPLAKGGSNPGAWANRADARYMVKIEVTENVNAVVDEVMANRFYGHLGGVMVPEAAIGAFPESLITQVVSQFLSNANEGSIEASLLEIYTKMLLYDGESGDVYGAGIVSKATEGYFNLGEQMVGTIEQEGRLPEFYSHKGEDIPIRGLAEAAALARVLGDNDWIGGTGGNLGLVIVENATDKYAQVVMVDPGQAFTLHYQEGFSSRNFGIAVQGQPELIQFDRLSEAHKTEFLMTLSRLAQASDDMLIGALTGERGLQDEIPRFLQMTGDFAEQASQYVGDKAREIRANIDVLCQIYREELRLLHHEEIIEEAEQVAKEEPTPDLKEAMMDYKKTYLEQAKKEMGDESTPAIHPSGRP